jgi:hypothetical protein
MTKRFTCLALAATAIFSMGFSARATASAHHMFDIESDSDWNAYNDPSKWGTQYNYSLSQLPLSGRMAGHQPWSDIYWPTNQAGIAARWNAQYSNGFDYRLLSESEVRALSPAELARLSPAEKYDIFMGRFDFPTVRELRGSLSRRAPYWSGICHGWSPAALHHAEPAAVTVTGKSGIAVPFGSGDVKALLDEYYADNAQASLFLGQTCKSGGSGSIWRKIRGAINKTGCDDVNAGALHVILTNELGIKKAGFVGDVDRWGEVWNQPIYAFRTRMVGESEPWRGAASGTVREVIVHTDMFYADELEHELWQPVVGTALYKEGVERYDYSLELDAAGRIIGGRWISGNRPDFLWNAPKLEFTGYMSGINSIYRPAVQR